MQHFKRTRIAPTPSGYLHLGNVLSFALTAALARKHGAKILLRIDDLDRERVQTAYVQDIFDTLYFLEIPYDDGPRDLQEYEQEWSQIHRMDNYRQALNILQEKDLLFACECSRAQIRASNTDIYPGTCRNKNIPLDTPNVSWRLKTDNLTPINVITLNGLLKATLPADMESFVVRKKDGFPAYQLTSVMDDLHFGVDLIVRGNDLWHSTLAQLYLAPLIGAHSFTAASFYHHPLLMASGAEKLSKSAGANSVHYLRSQGMRPQEILSLAAQMLGHDGPVDNWKQLAGLI